MILCEQLLTVNAPLSNQKSLKSYNFAFFVNFLLLIIVLFWIVKRKLYGPILD